MIVHRMSSCLAASVRSPFATCPVRAVRSNPLGPSGSSTRVSQRVAGSVQPAANGSRRHLDAPMRFAMARGPPRSRAATASAIVVAECGQRLTERNDISRRWADCCRQDVEFAAEAFHESTPTSPAAGVVRHDVPRNAVQPEPSLRPSWYVADSSPRDHEHVGSDISGLRRIVKPAGRVPDDRHELGIEQRSKPVGVSTH